MWIARKTTHLFLELQEKLDPRYVECLASFKMEAKANDKKKV
jgi:hypothetical protein